MKRSIFLLAIIINFCACLAQDKFTNVPDNDYQYITYFHVADNFPNVKFIQNEIDLNHFYKSLKLTYKKSFPLILVDYKTNQVALIPKKHVRSYNLDSVQSKNKETYLLYLSLIENFDVKSDSSNLLMMIVPKTVKHIQIKTTP